MMQGSLIFRGKNLTPPHSLIHKHTHMLVFTHTEKEVHINLLHYLLNDCHNCESDLRSVRPAHFSAPGWQQLMR